MNDNQERDNRIDPSPLLEEYRALSERVDSLQGLMDKLVESEGKKADTISEMQQTLAQALLELARMASTQTEAIASLFEKTRKNEKTIEELATWKKRVSGGGIDTRAEKMENYTRMVLEVLNQKFSLDEIDGLITHFNIDPENISGETVPTRARNFLLYMIRRDKLIDLIIRMRELRPKALLPQITGDDYV